MIRYLFIRHTNITYRCYLLNVINIRYNQIISILLILSFKSIINNKNFIFIILNSIISLYFIFVYSIKIFMFSLSVFESLKMFNLDSSQLKVTLFFGFSHFNKMFFESFFSAL